MKRQTSTLALLVFSVVVVMLMGSCQGRPSNEANSLPLPGSIGQQEVTLVDKQVTVARDGGSAKVHFAARRGEKIRIGLKASSPSSEPYGYLEWPDGKGEYSPLNQTAAAGENSAIVTLDRTGIYILTVFDGSNQGAIVRVTVQVIP
jgi:hypothetical protein